MTTHASPKRRGRGISAVERAKLLTHFQTRIAAREATDPSTPFQKLFKLASPVTVGASKLSDHHEALRRCFVLRAWCALNCARLLGQSRYLAGTKYTDTRGWCREAREALGAARIHRSLARSAREAGR